MLELAHGRLVAALMARTGLLEVQTVDTLPDGWKLWLQWKKARQVAGDDSPELASEIEVIAADGRQYMGFIRMIARRSSSGQEG